MTQDQQPAAADRRPLRTVEHSAPLLPAAIGLVRATASLSLFLVSVGVDADRRDPIDLEPRILRAA